MMQPPNPAPSASASVRSRRVPRRATSAPGVVAICCGGLLLGAVLASAAVPEPVSPGSGDLDDIRRAPACPTFSWSAPRGNGAVELVVLVGDPTRADRLESVFRRRLPAGAGSYTPDLGRCLEPARTYAWSVRTHGPDGPGEWSDAAWFRVPARGAEHSESLAEPAPRPRDPAGVRSRDGGRSPESRPPADEDDVRHSPAERPSPRGTPPTPDAVAIRGDVIDPGGRTAGVHGRSASGDAGSAGVLGESTAAAGEVHGVVARVQSASGIAAVFDNDGGGDVLLGRSSGGEVFRVDGEGDVTASSFAGDGSALTAVDAGTVDGHDSTAFLRSDQSDEVTSGTTTFQSGTTLDVDGALNASGATSVTLPSGGITGGGSGSGLDADLLDGLPDTSFLRSDTSDMVTSGTLTVAPAAILDVDGPFHAADLLLEGRIEVPVSCRSAARRGCGGESFLAEPGEAAGTNTAVGRRALRDVTSATANTAVGNEALANLSTGAFNTAVGAGALSSTTSSFTNTALGAQALTSDTTGFSNTGAGFWALHDTTTGSGNTAFGTSALEDNTIGNDNTALGRYALLENEVGENVAVGAFALSANVNGPRNTAIGTRALQSNIGGGFGHDNTAVGFEALRDGASNVQSSTAVGSGALRLANAFHSVAVGSEAQGSASTAQWSTAVGSGALANSTSTHFNTAVGGGASFYSTTGSNNTAVGMNSLNLVTTGSDNIALGFEAGSDLTGGDGSNIMVGNLGTSGDSNTVRIGTAGDHTRAFLAGIRGVTTGVADAIPVLIDSAGQFGTASSSRETKRDIASLGDLAERLLELRPVRFRYREHGPDGALQFGLIAEEVADVLPELVVFDAEGRPETVRYHLLGSLLLGEVQRQAARLQDQEALLARQEAALREQRRVLEAMMGRLARLEEGQLPGGRLAEAPRSPPETRPPPSGDR